MTVDILMPALSPTMTEGNLAKWHKQEGEAVRTGDILAEIETDKATVEVEAIDDGVLGKIVVPEGAEGIKVNEVIAIMLEEGEDAAALEAAMPEPAAPAPEPAAPPPVPAPVPPTAAAEAPPPQRTNGGGRIFASPLARRMAAQAGLDLASLAGSGPHGRIVKADIEAVLAGDAPAVEAAPAPPPTPAPGAELPGLPAFEEIPNNNVRKVIARRLVESKQGAPHFYLSIDCEVDRLLEVRRELNQRAPAEGPEAYKLSVNDFVIRALALALGRVPAANASWTEAAIRRYRAVDVSVAVAIPDGLITPVVRNAGTKGLATISREMRDLAARARAGKLTPEEYQGGTVSVSNLGMYGIREFSAVINPPQGAILAVGAAQQRPVVKEGALAVASVMSCTLSCDHRVVDGALGAELLAAFKTLIEDPLAMLL